MDFIKNLTLLETQLAATKEVDYTVVVINKIYAEWKKIKRRTNAVDLITNSANKIATLNPEAVQRCHDAAKIKLAIILMRCMDLPPWRPIDGKEKIYRRLYPLLKKMENVEPNTGSGGKLKEVVMTRLSCAISTQDPDKDGVFVAYEPRIPATYLRYLFGDTPPMATYRMLSMGLPEDFESLIEQLNINHQKAKSKFKKEGSVKH